MINVLQSAKESIKLGPGSETALQQVAAPRINFCDIVQLVFVQSYTSEGESLRFDETSKLVPSMWPRLTRCDTACATSKSLAAGSECMGDLGAEAQWLVQPAARAGALVAGGPPMELYRHGDCYLRY